MDQLTIDTAHAVLVVAYNIGALQKHPLTVMGMTFEMQMHTYHNTVSVTYNHKHYSISVYDTDSEDAQADTLYYLIQPFIAE